MKPMEKSPMQIYTCPTCGEQMDRDLLLFMKHTDRHIQDEIQKKRRKKS